MPTCKEALEFYKKAVRDGKGDMRTGHPYIAEESALKREQNLPDDEGKRKTKIAWDSADPDSYAEWHKERKRWMAVAHKNPTLSTDMMLVALKAYSIEGIQEVMEALGAAHASQAVPGVPRAQLPDWQQPEDSLKR
jgi:hypothetical protein